MKTSKPISTISFNTVQFLELKLNELLKAKKISFWAFIEHLPEDDEGGNKCHCHLYVEPSKMVQTDDLKAELMEYDPTKPAKPLGCLPWRSTNFDNWYLYALHDARYLASKQQARRYHYKHSQIVTSDDENLTFLARIIDLSALSPVESMKQAQDLGMSFDEYLSNGRVPIPQITQFQRAWELLWLNRTDRNGKPGHANSVDESTGEVFDSPSESPEKAHQSPSEPTWCGATRDEWTELYESATSDLEFIEIDPDELPY